ncbi:hypothetical protein SUGI_1067830 [Cryptomeria japonica]|nr:hypothetical protein SUGI_1067830 [Cryptomeria japonica]
MGRPPKDVLIFLLTKINYLLILSTEMAIVIGLRSLRKQGFLDAGKAVVCGGIITLDQTSNGGILVERRSEQSLNFRKFSATGGLPFPHACLEEQII